MPIETTCTGCSKLLRVADVHAGRLARCPHCQTIYTVPATAAASDPPRGASPFADLPSASHAAAYSAPFPAADSKAGGRWTLKTTDGLTFGPVPRNELDRWQAEGRITPQSQLQQEGSNVWMWAGQVYPHLQNFAADNPFAGQTAAMVNPYAPPASGGAYNWPGGLRYREQHRGGAILAMSIAGIIFCQFVAIAAFIMAIIDLGKMSKGTMDPAGRGLTIAGLVISSLSILLLVFVIIVNIIGAN